MASGHRSAADVTTRSVRMPKHQRELSSLRTPRNIAELCVILMMSFESRLVFARYGQENEHNTHTHTHIEKETLIVCEWLRVCVGGKRRYARVIHTRKRARDRQQRGDTHTKIVYIYIIYIGGATTDYIVSLNYANTSYDEIHSFWLWID